MKRILLHILWFFHRFNHGKIIIKLMRDYDKVKCFYVYTSTIKILLIKSFRDLILKIPFLYKNDPLLRICKDFVDTLDNKRS